MGPKDWWHQEPEMPDAEKPPDPGPHVSSGLWACDLVSVSTGEGELEYSGAGWRAGLGAEGRVGYRAWVQVEGQQAMGMRQPVSSGLTAVDGP